MIRSFCYYFLCLSLAGGLRAQTATGSWYGKADVDLAGMHNNYLTELVVKQKGNRVDGIFGYYFRDKYQSFFIHGTFNPKTREVIIRNIPLIYYNSNSTVNSIDCNSIFHGVLLNSKVGSSLKGHFYHDGHYKYMCPDLKVNYTLDKADQKHDSISSIATSDGKIWKPQVDDYVVDAAATKSQDLVSEPPPAKVVRETPRDSVMALAVKPVDSANADTARVAVVVKDSSASKPADTLKTVAVVKPPAADTAAAVPSPEKLEREDSKKIAESFTKRVATLNKVLEVESDSVRLSFYDNGDIDGDSISVFVNQHLALKHQELASKALTLFLRLDSTLEVNNISMFAENLGKLPPNTALMVVTDGKNRYEVFMSSSLTENATIQLKRRRKL